jgi:hypothetical protein
MMEVPAEFNALLDKFFIKLRKHSAVAG